MRGRALLTLAVMVIGVWIAVEPAVEGHISHSEPVREVGVGGVIAVAAAIRRVHDRRHRASG
ncbi:MAG TPA: hypothetical protein VGP96_00550 [Candidatus Dormibacteraeota bacterium]|nr:hypothetical protein [Candidatus Dormibacteraeota bacterium]